MTDTIAINITILSAPTEVADGRSSTALVNFRAVFEVVRGSTLMLLTISSSITTPGVFVRTYETHEHSGSEVFAIVSSDFKEIVTLQIPKSRFIVSFVRSTIK